MNIFPLTSPATSLDDDHIRSRHGEVIAIIASYPRWQGLQLHSLAAATEFFCDACERVRDSAMLATGDEYALVCPACYATLSHQDQTAEMAELPIRRAS